MVRTLLVVLVVAGCSSPGGSSGSPSRPPINSENPPRTQDPGRVMDSPSLQPSPPPERPVRGRHNIAPRPDGKPCLHDQECTSGICEGEGCGAAKPGTCAPRERACTKDLRPYCSCEGQTFRASGSCPGRRFASRTECSPP